LWFDRSDNRFFIVADGWNAHALLLQLLLNMLFATTINNAVATTSIVRRRLTNETVLIDLKPDIVLPLLKSSLPSPLLINIRQFDHFVAPTSSFVEVFFSRTRVRIEPQNVKMVSAVSDLVIPKEEMQTRQ
jgi:hypothetical protein